METTGVTSMSADEFIDEKKHQWTAERAISTGEIRPRPTPHDLRHITPERLLVGDLIILFRLLDRAVARAFGISGDSSTLLTLIIIGSFARGVRRVSAAPRTQVRKARSSPTFAGDTLIATGAVKETVDSIAGHPGRDTSYAAALIAFAVLAHSSRPAVTKSLHAARTSVRTVITEGLKLRAQFTARARSLRSGG
jgi:hypothetical protein